ncbi:uncharacterized protein LOC126319894 [Schistocerca gregaria]|uniref:uncharacterized protein LOC126319894 n=1 Tax=Schistocerca gregaria TaxID=7010 RepID=UPI00211F0036|nr:uncharacterized protein LOC126319894 [Schistocerca gregaria]
MFVFDWFWSVLSALGLYQKNAKIVFLGLDDAGKTTLLHMLRDNHLSVHFPTQKPTMEELTIGSIKFRAYDMGGHLQARKIWKEYFLEVNAVVFLVDTSNPARFPECKKELDSLLEAEELRKVPFAILGNKIDNLNSVTEEELRRALGLMQTYNQATYARPIEVFMCSVVKRIGYKEAFNWLSQLI